MTKAQAQTLTVTLLSIGIVVIDQIIKILVKTGMYVHESIHVTDWFYILFTQNNGMAFGMDFLNKIFLTSFRLFAVGFIIWYLCKAIRKGIPWGYLICMAMIMAGAAGNIIDCVFYGLIFNNPPAPFTAEFVNFGAGYGSLFQGWVVDMFYFPLCSWTWPDWMPLCGGQHFVFFDAIFNFADASISCGIIALFLFYRNRLFK